MLHLELELALTLKGLLFVANRFALRQTGSARAEQVVALYSVARFDFVPARVRAPRPQMPMPNPSAAPPHSPPYASISRGFLKIEWAAGRIFSVVLEYLYK